MAGGLVLMGALSLVLSVPAAMITHGYAQFWANGIRALSLRHHIYWPSLRYYIFGATLSLLVLKLIALVPEKAVLFLLMGLIPFVVIPLRRLQLDFQKPRHAIYCGFLVSGLQLLAGVAGPLLDIYFVRTSLNRHQIVATKALSQSLSHSLKIYYYWSLFSQNPQEVHWAFYLLCIPTALAGTQVGIKILNKMTDHQFLKWTQKILLAIGALYIFKGLDLLY